MPDRHDLDAFGLQDPHGLVPPEAAAPGPLMLMAMPQDLLFPRVEPGPLGRRLRGIAGALGRRLPRR
jgi:hypothetical protein